MASDKRPKDIRQLIEEIEELRDRVRLEIGPLDTAALVEWEGLETQWVRLSAGTPTLTKSSSTSRSAYEIRAGRSATATWRPGRLWLR